MSIIRHRMRAQTAITPHQGNKRILVPKRGVPGGDDPGYFWGVSPLSVSHAGMTLDSLISLDQWQTGEHIEFRWVARPLITGDCAMWSVDRAQLNNGNGGCMIDTLSNPAVAVIGYGGHAVQLDFDAVGVILDCVQQAVVTAAAFQWTSLIINGKEYIGAPLASGQRSALRLWMNGGPTSGLTSQNRSTLFKAELHHLESGDFWSWPIEEGAGNIIGNGPGSQVSPCTMAGTEGVDFVWVDRNSTAPVPT